MLRLLRLLCPHCHALLGPQELDPVDIDGQLALLCPECASLIAIEGRDPAGKQAAEEMSERVVLHHV